MNTALNRSYGSNKLYKTLSLKDCSRDDICTKLCDIYDRLGWDMTMKAAYIHWGIPRSEFRAPLPVIEGKDSKDIAHDRIKAIVNDSFSTWESVHQ